MRAAAPRIARAGGFGCATLLTALLALPSACEDTARPSASVALHDCRAGKLEAKCGVVEVLEDPARAEGRKLELAVTLVPSSSRSPAADPVFLLAGGPGQGAAAAAYFVAPMLDPILRERDLVFVDLRGTGRSSPLACELEDPFDLDDMLSGELDLTELERCLAGYEADLRQYTTATMMDDLDQVRAALGYEQINLFGISHGSRAALTYMRDHGEHVRSVVLDGVAPLDYPVYRGSPASAERVLDELLRECREDADCGAAYPGLERELEQVLTGLETGRRLIEIPHPRTGELQRVNVTVKGFMGVVRSALYTNEYAVLLPLAIHAAHRGDFGPIAALAVRVGAVSKTISMGLYFNVACAEELKELDADARREASEGLRWFDGQGLAELHEACLRWPALELPAEEGAPISSEVPTLILSGAHDPITPPELGEHVAAQLGNARHVVVEAVHHGVWSRGCTPELVAGFFAEPDPAALDPSCYDQLQRQRIFLTPNGPRPLSVQDDDEAKADPDRGPALAQQESEQ